MKCSCTRHYKASFMGFGSFIEHHCRSLIDISLRCEAFNESQGKPDDIQALEMKLRSLFMDMGGGGSATGGDLSAADPASGAHAAGTSSPMGPCPTSSTSVTTPVSSQPANPPQPPCTLPLGSPAPAQRPGTPISTPAPIGM